MIHEKKAERVMESRMGVTKQGRPAQCSGPGCIFHSECRGTQ